MARGTVSGHTLAGHTLSGHILEHLWDGQTAQLLVCALLVVVVESRGVPLVPLTLPSHTGQQSVLSLENVF